MWFAYTRFHRNRFGI